MQKALLHEKTNNKSYRHFSINSGITAHHKKLEFFYIGKRTDAINSLIDAFGSGYAAESTEQAKTMIRKMSGKSERVTDVIFADATLGHDTLMMFSQFLSINKHMSEVPFFIEGTQLADDELKRFHRDPVGDDIISVIDMAPEKLIKKVNFWRRIRKRIDNIQQPMNNDMSKVYLSPSDIFKRIFDIVVSSVLIVALIPVFLLIALALRIESKGPVFYISKRAGKGFKIFDFYKFRTMDPSAKDTIADMAHLNIYNPLKVDGPVFIKIDNDPRVTKLGAFLRKCSLDELPQLVNVLKGDMSLVGNRPLPLYEATTLTTDEWAKRFMAPAGITGLWQIKKKAKQKMTAEERIRLDINYVEKSNFFFDLWIMANTPSAAIQRTNA